MKKTIFIIAIIATAAMVTGVKAQISIGLKGGLTIPNLTSNNEFATPLSEGYGSIMAFGGGAFAEFQISKTFSLQAGLEYSRQGGQKNGFQAMPAEKFVSTMYTPACEGLVQTLIRNQFPEAQAKAIGAAAKSMMPTDYLWADFSSKAEFDYIMLPVQAKFGWNLGNKSPFRVYVSAGFFASYLTSARQVTSGKSDLKAYSNGLDFYGYARATPTFGSLDAMSRAILFDGFGQMPGFFKSFDENVKNQSFDNTTDITSDVNRINVGFIGGVGFSYQVCNRGKVFIEGGGNYGFLNIQKDYQKNGKNNIGAGSVMVGYSFTL